MIGASGGNIGWIDEGSHLQVDPHSAGAVPGPACYGRGGSAPTLTDVALLVGYLDPNNFSGGDIPLTVSHAQRAIQSQLADALNMPPVHAASGMLRISEAKISGAIREISIERGFHPKDFTILALGGGGGLVATSAAREPGVPTVIIPPGPANFSALGMLMVDGVHDFVQTHQRPGARVQTLVGVGSWHIQTEQEFDGGSTEILYDMIAELGDRPRLE